jgi:hypothetical protein
MKLLKPSPSAPDVERHDSCSDVLLLGARFPQCAAAEH